MLADISCAKMPRREILTVYQRHIYVEYAEQAVCLILKSSGRPGGRPGHPLYDTTVIGARSSGEHTLADTSNRSDLRLQTRFCADEGPVCRVKFDNLGGYELL